MRPASNRKILQAILAASIPCAVLSGNPAQAYEEHMIAGQDGKNIFGLRFFSPEDPAPWADEGKDIKSTWELSPQEKTNILDAGHYWASVIKPQIKDTPAIINIGTYDDENAFGDSHSLSDENLNTTAIAVNLQLETIDPAELDYDAHGAFVMGKLKWDSAASSASQLPFTQNVDMSGVAIHEIAHGLGISSSAGYLESEKLPFFTEDISEWTKHLVDDNGNYARPEQAILCSACDTEYSAQAFDVRKEQGMFVGEHVSEALEGGLPGVPVSMTATLQNGKVALDNNYMSHIELKNSMMSHQTYRNYTSFMEAELAILQDLGYDIDRRQFFGRSIYGSGMQITNDRPYFARDPEGKEYLPGQYNLAEAGLGLHVYGSDNQIIQQADLLSAGKAGAGIRVDGQGNQIEIAPSANIHALGENGIGVLFAYGKDHGLTQRGTVLASGAGGVALSFDFGNNSMGNYSDYRGSYIRTSNVTDPVMLDELNGPLVRQVDITGTLVGAKAAISMAESALVERVNIMRGAQIEGDISSAYAQRDADGAWRASTITMGLQSQADGRASEQPDPEFLMQYNGNISGAQNLKLELAGGHTQLNGQHQLLGLEVQGAATLSGQASYAIDPSGVFQNNGNLIIGSGDGHARVKIDGNFSQSAGAALFSQMLADGSHDQIKVNGQARLDGTLSLAMQSGWYPNHWNALAQPLQADSYAGEFARLDAPWDSPTLKRDIYQTSPGSWQINVNRAQDAYARFGHNANDRRAGAALVQAADFVGTQSGDSAAWRDLLTGLDFSKPDGSTVAQALRQIGPSAYSADASLALARAQRTMTQTSLALRPSLRTLSSAAGATDKWQSYGAVTGGINRQSSGAETIEWRAHDYGILLGANTRLARAPDFIVGASLDLGQERYSLGAGQSAQGKTSYYGLGLQLGYLPDARLGPYAWGGVHLGMESGALDRSLGFGGYSASHSASWRAHSLSAQIGAGQRWALGDAASWGPLVTLDYSRFKRPSFSEDGPRSTSLELESLTAQSLQSGLGLAIQSQHETTGGTRLNVYAQASWQAQLLARSQRQNASFAALPGVSINSSNQLSAANSLGLQLGVELETRAGLSLHSALSASGGGGQRAAAAEVGLRWRF